jgi:hypothetical protein
MLTNLILKILLDSDDNMGNMRQKRSSRSYFHIYAVLMNKAGTRNIHRAACADKKYKNPPSMLKI